MTLQNPVAIFTASSNNRAHMICHLLIQSGIEAHVTEDESLVGLWWGGTLPGVHTPKVWVDRADAERAASIIQENERREAELRQPSTGSDDELQVVCPECGQTAPFPSAQRGSVQ